MGAGEGTENPSRTTCVKGEGCKELLEAFLEEGGIDGLVTLEREPKARVFWVARADLRRVGGMVNMRCMYVGGRQNRSNCEDSRLGSIWV